MLVEPEEILERDGRQRLVLAANRDAFLGLDGLVDAVGIAAPVHQTSRELVHDDDLAVLDDVLLVLVEQVPRFQCGVELVGELDVALIVEVRDAQHLLDLGHARFRDRNGVRLFVHRVVFFFLEPRDDLREFAVEIG